MRRPGPYPVLWVVVSQQCKFEIVWVRGRLWNASFELTLYGHVVSVCCVGFASLDVVCDELHDCIWSVGL